VIDTDQLVMVSDGGQLIRLPVSGISFTGRTARGVTLFRVGESERVVSVTRFREVGGSDAVEDGAADEAGEETPSGQ
jgi:DNA gyrase subunit A